MTASSGTLWLPRRVHARRQAPLPQLARLERAGVHLCGSRYRQLIRTSAEGGQSSVQYEELDIVEFISPKHGSGAASSPAIGCIVSISGDEVSIEELQRDPDPSTSMWTQSGDEYVVPISALRRTFEANFSQRIDSDRISNPHGEHAHDVWQIPDLL